MSNPTPNLNLNRPAQTEFYNVDVFNQNADRIDAAIARIDENFVPPRNAFTGIDTLAATTVARTVNVATPFTRNVGTVVWVKFQNRVTSTNPTLSINGTVAARIRVRNGNDTSIANFITPGRYYCFLYTEDATVGAAWQLLNPDGVTILRTISATAAGTAAKVATLAGFSRVPGAIVWVTFSTHNTAVTPTLNISSTGAATINFGRTRQLITGRRYAFSFDGTAYQLVAADLSGEKDGFAEVTTTAGTVAKVANIPEFVRQIGSTVWLRFTAGNTTANPTLNVNATSAAAIQLNGGALPSGAIIANGVYGFVFDGVAWQILNPTLALNASTILDIIYPIGSIYMSVNATSPATLMGGTWVRWGNGHVPVGVNEADSDFTHTTATGRTGGAKTHTLMQAEMPSHSHTVNSHSHGVGTLATASAGAHGHSTGISTSSNTANAGSNNVARFQNTNDVPTFPGGVHSHTISGSTATASPATNSIGSGTAHNNLQPYITCFMWRRTG